MAEMFKFVPKGNEVTLAEGVFAEYEAEARRRGLAAAEKARDGDRTKAIIDAVLLTLFPLCVGATALCLALGRRGDMSAPTVLSHLEKVAAMIEVDDKSQRPRTMR